MIAEIRAPTKPNTDQHCKKNNQFIGSSLIIRKVNIPASASENPYGFTIWFNIVDNP
jgi:hypothetical protein